VSLGPIRVTRLAGSPEAMGERHGATFADEIRTYAEGRISLSAEGTSLTRDELVAVATSMLPAHEEYDAALHAEMLAMASAAGLSPGEAVIVGGYTDFLDTVRAVAGAAPTENNCTSVIVPDELSDGAGFLAQTWDMNASATPHVVLFDIAPEGGPSALVFTTVGTLGQIGMNEAGIAIGINNLTVTDGTVGVTWPFVVRKVLAQTRFEDALDAITGARLAGGHSFLLFDDQGRGAVVEALPSRTHVERMNGRLLVHTNHCLVAETQAAEAIRPVDLDLSSKRRLAEAHELLSEVPITYETLAAMTRDERSICRHPEPPFDYATCGAAIMRPATRDFWACWGLPSENDYEHHVVGARP
jgi:isopenicillin-N N-acyltransferase-like protein